MCNSLHKDSESIQTEGKGWKIFFDKNKPMINIIHKPSDYLGDTKKCVKWHLDNKTMSGLERGFCFFLTKKEARRALKLWKQPKPFSKYHRRLSVRKIEYKEGLGSHHEAGMLGPNYLVYIALCKEFKIL